MSVNDGNTIKRTSQYIDNLGFDETTQLPMVELGGTDGVNVSRLAVNTDGSIIARSAMSIPAHDYIAATQDTTTDTYVYKLGGVGGTTVATLTITYTDSSKANIQSIGRT